MYTTLIDTIDFAAQKHSKQRRKNADASPYIEHPIGVAKLIAKVGKVEDLATLQAAVLHDTLEDTDTTFEELKQHFGEEVANIVQEVTDDKNLSKDERKRHQISHAGHISTKAKTVKLGDKLHNLSSLQQVAPVGWKAKRIQGYFVWAHAVVAKLRGTNPHLEAALDKVFSATFKCDEGEFPTLPSNMEAALEEYLNEMQEAGKTER